MRDKYVERLTARLASREVQVVTLLLSGENAGRLAEMMLVAYDATGMTVSAGDFIEGIIQGFHAMHQAARQPLRRKGAK